MNNDETKCCPVCKEILQDTQGTQWCMRCHIAEMKKYRREWLRWYKTREGARPEPPKF
jgi:hypothetical protein